MTILEAFRTVMGDDTLVARPVGVPDYAVAYCESSYGPERLRGSVEFRKLKYNSGWQDWRTVAGLPTIPVEHVRKDWETIQRDQLPKP